MARSFWERWQWELGQRKEAVKEFVMQRGSVGKQVKSDIQFQEIDRAMLLDLPSVSSDTERYIGRGSFGVVKLQRFRGINVAVKELLPRTNLIDVQQEACVLSKLCHPFLPYLVGVCTAEQPYCVIMQFHGIFDKTVTLSSAIKKKEAIGPNEHIWLGLCGQLLDAVQYLHDEAGILHNDLKSNNVLVTDNVFAGSLDFQVVVIDFGKATDVNKGRRYDLSDLEKSEYTRKFPYMAPEVIDGLSRQTELSDMYSVGEILYTVIDYCFGTMSLERKKKLMDVAEKCRCPKPSKRISAHRALLYWQQQEL